MTDTEMGLLLGGSSTTFYAVLGLPADYLVGMGEAAITPASYSLIRGSFPPEKRPRAFGVCVSRASGIAPSIRRRRGRPAKSARRRARERS
jgi:MFS family permease